MKIERRRFLKAAAAAVALPMIPLPAVAAPTFAYPFIAGMVFDDAVIAMPLLIGELFPFIERPLRQAEPPGQ